MHFLEAGPKCHPSACFWMPKARQANNIDSPERERTGPFGSASGRERMRKGSADSLAFQLREATECPLGKKSRSGSSGSQKRARAAEKMNHAPTPRPRTNGQMNVHHMSSHVITVLCASLRASREGNIYRINKPTRGNPHASRAGTSSAQLGPHFEPFAVKLQRTGPSKSIETSQVARTCVFRTFPPPSSGLLTAHARI